MKTEEEIEQERVWALGGPWMSFVKPGEHARRFRSERSEDMRTGMTIALRALRIGLEVAAKLQVLREVAAAVKSDQSNHHHRMQARGEQARKMKARKIER